MGLRHYLYNDRDLVQDYLSQIEKGLIEEVTETNQTTGTGGGGFKAGVPPISLELSKKREQMASQLWTIKQTASSEVDRLCEYLQVLEDENLITLESVSDMDLLSSIGRKSFVEADATIVLSEAPRLLGVLQSTIELDGDEDDDDNEVAKFMEIIGEVENTGRETLPVIATVPGSTGLKVGLELKRTALLTEKVEVDATMLFRVQRILQEGERYSVGNPLEGLPDKVPLNIEKGFREIVESGSPDDFEDLGIRNFYIVAPAFVGIPIAIWV